MDFKGKIYWRGEPGYENARTGRVFNHRRPARFPAAVFFPKNENDVVAAVLFAKEKNYKIAIRAGGHSWAAWSVRDEGILLDLQFLNKIKFDKKTNIARVQPAVKGGLELNPFLKKYGRFFPGGHCPTVGVGGFLLQGGQGWNARGWGWAAENIVAIDVVTAAGELVRADAGQNSDLFWAARGAGPGFFGVVTCFHLKTLPLPKALFASTFLFPTEFAEPVLKWWQEIHGTISLNIELVALGQTVPKIEGIAGENIPVVIVHALVLEETVEAARAALQVFQNCPFLEKTFVRRDFYETTFDEQIKLQLEANPENHRWAVNNSWLEGSPDDILRLILPAFTDLPTAKTFSLWYSMAPLRPLPDMAFSMQTEIYFAIYVIWENADDDLACQNWLKKTMRRLEPVTAGQYLGDSDFRSFPRKFMADANFERLQKIRTDRDPQGIFHSYLSNPDVVLNQNIWQKSERVTRSHPLTAKLRPHHVGISVANLEESIAWYFQFLGFELVWKKDFEGIKTQIAFLKNGDFQIELFGHHETEPLEISRKSPLDDIQKQGTKHICFAVKDLKTVFEKLENDGADIAMSLRKSPPGDAWMCFVRDPTGNLIEIIQLI